MIDASGSRVLVRTEDPDLTAYWIPFKKQVNVIAGLFPTSLQGDAKHGLVSVAIGSDYRCGRLVRTKRPNRPLWTTASGYAFAFSPDGTKALTGRFTREGDMKTLHVRLVEDGTLLHAYRTGGVAPDPIHWDGTTTSRRWPSDAHDGRGQVSTWLGAASGSLSITEEFLYDPTRLTGRSPPTAAGIPFNMDESFYYDEY